MAVSELFWIIRLAILELKRRLGILTLSLIAFYVRIDYVGIKSSVETQFGEVTDHEYTKFALSESNVNFSVEV